LKTSEVDPGAENPQQESNRQDELSIENLQQDSFRKKPSTVDEGRRPKSLEDGRTGVGCGRTKWDDKDRLYDKQKKVKD